MSNPAVEYRRLGKSGLRVSVPILGGMSFGNHGWGVCISYSSDALLLLKAAWDRGVTTIDTANVYSNGDSERIIGKFIKQYNIPRGKLVILTKCYHIVSEDPKQQTALQVGLGDTRDYVNQGGLSRAAIFNAVNASLERLGTDYIDLLQIHRFDPNTPPAEIMKALHDLVQSGKVRYIGASSMRTWQFAELNHIAEINGWTKFISMQNEYSLLYREAEREMNAYCNYHGIGLIPYGPLHSGDLARPLGTTTVRSEHANAALKGTPYEKKLSETDEQIITRTIELSKKRGWAISQVALAWVCMKVTSPIVGVDSVERLDQAIITGKTLTEDEIKYLEEPYVPRLVRGHA
ncbi:Aldo keto reductase [Rickenella mellea]|uniref:Aldo keto reductase n=1 Tax=Rickenella mellea TaxID=50990 RepID=A0A4Y7PX97_9AGAM|nr:Aldo keto reductase [Rickenella mellea]